MIQTFLQIEQLLPTAGIPVFWQIVLAIIATLFGGGFFTLLIKEIFARKRNLAEVSRYNAETDQIHLNVEAAQIGQIVGNNKTIKDLLADSESNVKKMREQNSQISQLTAETEDLHRSIEGKNAIIQYQKEERREWTELLFKVQQKVAESQVHISELEKKVAALEAANEEFTKSKLRTPDK